MKNFKYENNPNYGIYIQKQKATSANNESLNLTNMIIVLVNAIAIHTPIIPYRIAINLISL